MNHRFATTETELALDGNPLAGEVVEIPLLLPGWQATALETVAHDHGLTAAEMVRQLLRDYIGRLSEPPEKVLVPSSK